jgi:uncharacterized membrane protein
MPRFCAFCGAQVADAAAFCAGCGKPVNPAAETTAAPATAPAAPATPAGGEMADNVAGMLAYITIIPAIIFLLMEPYNRRPFVRFHSFQCIFVHVGMVVLWVALLIISAVLAIIPILGHLVAFLLWMMLVVLFLVIWIVVLLKAYQGQMWKLPIAGDLAAKQAGTL